MDGGTIAAIATPVGGALGFLARHFFTHRDQREQSLLKREREWQVAVESRLAKVEKAYGVVVGVVHVIVDDLEPEHASLGSIRALLKDAFPAVEETPEELLTLIARLDVKERRGAQRRRGVA